MDIDEVLIKDNEAVEDLLHGKMKIIQSNNGYRFSIDAVLLANFVRAKKEDNIIDLGTGSGVIPLILSHRHHDLKITGLELDPHAADMAKRSVELNGLSHRIIVKEGDIREIKTLFPPESFSLVVANPPYGKPGSGHVNPEPGKATARHEIEGGLDDFISAAAYLLKQRERFFLIYPARRLADVISVMRDNGSEPKRMQMVHSREGEGARLILVEGIKGGGVEMEVMKPLYIYDDEGGYTPEIESIYS